jgi:hypothetical protein
VFRPTAATVNAHKKYVRPVIGSPRFSRWPEPHLRPMLSRKKQGFEAISGRKQGERGAKRLDPRTRVASRPVRFGAIWT